MKRLLLIAASIACVIGIVFFATRESDPIRHVYPGDSIQAALDAAAADDEHKHVIVHAGEYRPQIPGQAFIWFNQKHNGITLEADGEVILDAGNPEIADKAADSFPAIVNHVVYFGDRIQSGTVMRGFTIRGANDFVTDEEGADPIQPPIPQGENRKLCFYCDGGGIKIYGRSFPTIDRVVIEGCYSSPCGAAISIEHRGANYNEQFVRLTNCVFRSNRVPATGSGVDLLWGSRAIIQNCLFVGNLSNETMDERSKSLGFWKEKHGSGALTLLPSSTAIVDRCTFVGNRNGVDDSGLGSLYSRCVFWQNNAPGGWPKGARYELDIVKESRVVGCMINGDTPDLAGTVDPTKNTIGCEDPKFDEQYVPQAPGFENAGYRPVAAKPVASSSVDEKELPAKTL